MFGDTLKQMRTRKGLTQKELAAMLDTTNSAIAYWESNNRQPSCSMLKKISNILEFSLDEALKTDYYLNQDIYSKNVLDVFNVMNEEGKKRVLEYATLLATKSEYRQRNIPSENRIND